MTIEEERNLKRDLEATKLLLLRQNPSQTMKNLLTGKNHFEDSKYETLYAHATEDMRTYYTEFNHPKTFLSICASGDQIINAILTGATVIDAFDSNRLCRYGLNLKLAALKALTKEELILYYETFNPYLFTKIAEYLDEPSLIYWFNVYQISGPEMIGAIIKDFIFAYKKLDRSVIIDINPYLKGSNYQKVRENLSKTTINYIDSDLYNLPSHLGNKKYDAMNFSNIYEYINFGRQTSPARAEKYYSFLMNYLYPKLNEGGTMMAAYVYSYSDSVNEDFKKLYAEYPDKMTYPGAITFDELPYYIAGLTSQNLSYSYLFDHLGENNETVKKVLTKHIQYGQSNDMSHDTAICIKK